VLTPEGLKLLYKTLQEDFKKEPFSSYSKFVTFKKLDDKTAEVRDTTSASRAKRTTR
jgi:thymidine kinase